RVSNRMSQHQRRQSVQKPSGLEIYNDAVKILEELLEKDLDKNLQVPRKVRRNKTDPNSETVVTNLSVSENALVRIKIQPYRHSKSLDEKLSQKDLLFLKDKNSQKKGKNQHLRGSDSSIDTDDEQALGSVKHKKKNLLKRAKERILQTLRRDQKEPPVKTTNKSSADSTPSKKQSLKHKHLEESLSEAHSPKHAHVGKVTNTEHTEERTRDSIRESTESPSPSSQRLNVASTELGHLSGGLLQPESNGGPAVRVLFRAHSNVLDSPGEDIQFMDIDNPVITVRNSSSGGESLVGPAQITRGQPAQSVTDREALYGRIAQKLIEMGDFYSTSASDQEAGAAAAVQPATLTDLENEIITCLRAEGDRYSKQFDESFEEVTQQTVQETYQRFRSTVKNSMGSELSWDHVAFLFYTTKGVVSAVGQGSRTATRVKEFTLQYITDTFASWIINQGGFDSVLSSEESDFDID
ncbi:unnamed protein product, partial [Candidula unifasciata]